MKKGKSKTYLRGNEFRQQGRRKERGERRESGAKRGWRKAFWAGRLEGGNRSGEKGPLMDLGSVFLTKLGFVGAVLGMLFGGGRGFVFGRLKRASEGALEA